jgi:hypothetical protein
MAANTLVKIESVELNGEDGPLTAIMVALNIADPRRAPAFIREVAETFKAHRMCSPPKTTGLLVTILGQLPAERFVEQWRKLAVEDEMLAHFMSQLSVADVMQGTADGRVLSSASLLGE